MSAENPFGWLWQDEVPDKPAVRAPEGFSASGFLGLWKIAPLYRTWATSGIDLDIVPYKCAYDSKSPFPTGTFYYWKSDNENQGKEAAKIIGGGDADATRKAAPRPILRWEMDTTDWMNASNAEVKERFGALIAFDMGMASLMYRGAIQYEYHLFFLPSLAQSMAIAAGLLKEPVYDYSALPVDAETATVEQFEALCGADGGKGYGDSILWKARTQLWAALGEDNPKAYAINQGGLFDITPKTMLWEALSITARKQTALYCEVLRVADPRPAEGEKRSFSMHVISRVFLNKKSAQEYVASVRNVDTKATGYPPLPDAWSGGKVGDWTTWVKEYITKTYGNKPRPVVVKALREDSQMLEEQYACTPEDIVVWWDHVFTS